jgi:hypothetical protein
MLGDGTRLARQAERVRGYELSLRAQGNGHARLKENHVGWLVPYDSSGCVYRLEITLQIVLVMQLQHA